jgi:hypothetical protein
MFSTQNSLVGTNFTENMMAGKNGEIWIGTYDAGVVEYIPASPAVVMPPAQIESQSFVSYPNPASAAVRCQVGGIGEAPAIVTILDLLGRTVMSIYVANAGDFSLDTRSLPDGVYTIVAKSESHVGRGQFIVAR